MSEEAQNKKKTADIPEWTADGFGMPVVFLKPTNHLQIEATARCNGRDWQSIPGTSIAEFRILNPELKFQLRDETISASLDCEVETRSKARKPNGEPWVQVSARFAGALDTSGKINLQLPAWPSFEAIKTDIINARALCEEVKRRDIKLPGFPEEPRPPQQPNHPRPKFPWPPTPQWVAYDAAVLVYKAALEAYRFARQKYEEAVKMLNDALTECQNNFPDPPEDLRYAQLPPVSCRLTDLLR